MELSAPGKGIYSTIRNNSYGFKTGTSMAAPIVAGVAALCRAKWPNATSGEIRKIMQGFAIDINAPGWDSYTGFGIVDAYRTLYHPDAVDFSEILNEAEQRLGESYGLAADGGFSIDPNIPDAVGD